MLVGALKHHVGNHTTHTKTEAHKVSGPQYADHLPCSLVTGREARDSELQNSSIGSPMDLASGVPTVAAQGQLAQRDAICAMHQRYSRGEVGVLDRKTEVRRGLHKR